MNAQAKFNNAIAAMSDDLILETLTQITRDGIDRSLEGVTVRVGLLDEWERRHGGEQVDRLMDMLEKIRA